MTKDKKSREEPVARSRLPASHESDEVMVQRSDNGMRLPFMSSRSVGMGRIRRFSPTSWQSVCLPVRVNKRLSRQLRKQRTVKNILAPAKRAASV